MANKVFYKDKLMEMIDNHLTRLKTNELDSSVIFHDISESLLKKGKKIRPLIFLNMIESRSFEFDANVGCLALSIEMLHCASLIIDDLPSMDNDEMRRGEPTIHRKYGTKKALVVSNKLIFDALKNIMRICDRECKLLILDQLKDATLGQYFDITGVTNSDNEHLSDIINLKTAPFFNIAFILAGFYNKEGYEDYIKMGNLFSGMFQICDDIEDYVKDLKKGHTMNHSILMGREKSLDMYLSRRRDFIKCLQDNKIYLPYFIYLIELLDNKLGLDL